MGWSTHSITEVFSASKRFAGLYFFPKLKNKYLVIAADIAAQKKTVLKLYATAGGRGHL